MPEKSTDKLTKAALGLYPLNDDEKIKINPPPNIEFQNENTTTNIDLSVFPIIDRLITLKNDALLKQYELLSEEEKEKFKSEIKQITSIIKKIMEPIQECFVDLQKFLKEVSDVKNINKS